MYIALATTITYRLNEITGYEINGTTRIVISLY